jgi:hypothetical protein
MITLRKEGGETAKYIKGVKTVRRGEQTQKNPRIPAFDFHSHKEYDFQSS